MTVMECYERFRMMLWYIYYPNPPRKPAPSHTYPFGDHGLHHLFPKTSESKSDYLRKPMHVQNLSLKMPKKTNSCSYWIMCWYQKSDPSIHTIPQNQHNPPTLKQGIKVHQGTSTKLQCPISWSESESTSNSFLSRDGLLASRTHAYTLILMVRPETTFVIRMLQMLRMIWNV